VKGAIPYPMSALPHSPAQIASAMHPEQLPERDATYIFVDYAQDGIGNRSCGPEALPQYRLKASHARFGFTLAPDASAPSSVPAACRGIYEAYAGTTGGSAPYRDPSDPDQQRAIGMNV